MKCLKRANDAITSLTAKERPVGAPSFLTAGADKKSFQRGSLIYNREGHCGTCHQSNGAGLPASGFPPLAQSEWVTDPDTDRLIKLSLKGLMGPITVKGKEYPGQVPMTAFEHLLNDQDMADVLTFVRASFGNKGSAIKKEDVARVRGELKGQNMILQPAKLLEDHPFAK